MSEREYPLVDKTKWQLVVRAPLSESGCDEIIMTAETKRILHDFLGRFLGPHDLYEIRKKDGD